MSRIISASDISRDNEYGTGIYKESVRMKHRAEKLEKARSVVWVIFIVTLILALLYMAVGIMQIMNGPATSFPWYSACLFAGVYFGPLLIAELIAYAIMSMICRKRGKFEKK